MAAFGILTFSTLASAGSINKLTGLLSAADLQYANVKMICHGQIVGDCSYGNEKKRVLIIGDSHAAQLNLSFQTVASLLDISATVLTSSSCIPIEGFNLGKLPVWAQKACSNQIEHVQSLLKQYDHIVLAGMWTYQTQDPAFISALKNFILNLNATSSGDKQRVTVTLIAQLPKFVNDPARSFRLAHFGFDVVPDFSDDTTIANDLIRTSLEDIPSVSFLDLSNNPLFKSAPFLYGKLMYSDSHHLNER